MGQRGPKKTPTTTLAQRGSWRAKTRDEPAAEPLEKCPSPPRNLSAAARSVWSAIAPSLWASGRLTADDVPAFGRYCQAHARFAELDKALDLTDRASVMSWRDLHTMLKEYDARFGLTPADRAEMALPRKPKADAEPPVGSGGLSVVA